MKIREGKWPGNGRLVRGAMRQCSDLQMLTLNSLTLQWGVQVSRELLEMNECLGTTERLNEHKILPPRLTRTSSLLANTALLEHKQVWKYQQSRISKFIQSRNCSVCSSCVPFPLILCCLPFCSMMGILVQTLSKTSLSGSTAFYIELMAREYVQD